MPWRLPPQLQIPAPGHRWSDLEIGESRGVPAPDQAVGDDQAHDGGDDLIWSAKRLGEVGPVDAGACQPHQLQVLWGPIAEEELAQAELDQIIRRHSARTDAAESALLDACCARQ